ncbi:response regulator, partial [Achromobacter xylosoxidans]|nr:response regulator [Achromobacter xylosoxidans]
ALLNLVINARDAMPAGGQLTISVRHVDGRPAANGAPGQPGPQVALSVQDTGVGIADDVVAHVFEPFFSTKSKHQNSGLGLSQVQGFVRQSGGDVAVRSKVGQGTTFTLYLPAATAASAVAGPVDADVAARVTTRKAVLLVEDNRMVGEVVSTLLTDLGQDLTWATDAESALRMLQEKQGRFDIAILDIVLPGMDGVQLAEMIKAQWPAIRVVLATGYSEALAGRDAGALEVMQKPYSIEALTRLLAAH